MIILLPLFLAVFLSVLIFSGQPVFFWQQRIGLDGNKFFIIKFRTMIVGAEEKVDEIKNSYQIKTCFFSLTDDPRITWIGKIIRFFELDELPQFINVLLGQMTIVGPRPQSVKFLGDKDFEKILVKPGLFDEDKLKQKNLRLHSNGVNVETIESWIEAGRKYVEKSSFFYDLFTIFSCLIYFFRKIASPLISHIAGRKKPRTQLAHSLTRSK